MADASDLETTIDLVDKTRQGDPRARDLLVRRYLPLLKRWAHGRLPSTARDLSETEDIVQLTLLRAFQNLPAFEVQGHGAFFGYLRQITVNLVRDEMRRAGRRPVIEELDDSLVESDPTPLARTISQETISAYERALASMPEAQRELIVMKVELGLSNDEISEIVGSPSTNAARMRIARSLAELATLMSAFKPA